MELGTNAGMQLTTRKDGAVAMSTHPRGAGFRVLSRMARSCAADEPSYAPRHRLDSESDCCSSATA